MPDIPEPLFTRLYGEIHTTAWADPKVKNSLLKEPSKVLKAFGLDPEGAKVVIKHPVPGAPASQANQGEQCRLWNEGKKKGTIEFYFQETPPPDLAQGELTDAELMAVAGGLTISHCCCCCSPCCSC